MKWTRLTATVLTLFFLLPGAALAAEDAIEIGGMAVPCALEGDTLTISPTPEQTAAILDAGEGDVWVYISQIPDAERVVFDAIPSLFAEAEAGLTLVFDAQADYDEPVRYLRLTAPGALWGEFAEQYPERDLLSISFAPARTDDALGKGRQGGVISMTVDGREAEYLALRAPLLLSHDTSAYTGLPPGYHSWGSCHYQILEDGSQVALARSWDDGGDRAKIYTGGTYVPSASRDPGQPYTDVAEGSWMEAAVKYMTARRVVQGDEGGYFNGSFNPHRNVTREEAAVMICRTLGYINPDGEQFPDHGDISEDALEAVYTLKGLGILTGDQDGSVNPKAEISRQELFAMLHRTMDCMDMYGEPRSSIQPVFSDWDRLSAYAVEAAETLVQNGLIRGDGEWLNPRGQVTRAECTQMLYNILLYDQTVLP